MQNGRHLALHIGPHFQVDRSPRDNPGELLRTSYGIIEAVGKWL